MGVSLCCSDASMPEHFLDVSQVDTAGDKMSGKAMSKCVW